MEKLTETPYKVTATPSEFFGRPSIRAWVHLDIPDVPMEEKNFTGELVTASGIIGPKEISDMVGKFKHAIGEYWGPSLENELRLALEMAAPVRDDDGA